jgi:hypothetical protein
LRRYPPDEKQGQGVIHLIRYARPKRLDAIGRHAGFQPMRTECAQHDRDARGDGAGDEKKALHVQSISAFRIANGAVDALQVEALARITLYAQAPRLCRPLGSAFKNRQS